jgi:kynurenine formamidase
MRSWMRRDAPAHRLVGGIIVIDIPVIDFITPIVGQILDLIDTSAFDNYDNCLT